MKRYLQLVVFALLGVLWMACETSVKAETDGSVPGKFYFTLECRTASTNGNKYGTTWAYEQACPPKIPLYRTSAKDILRTGTANSRTDTSYSVDESSLETNQMVGRQSEAYITTYSPTSSATVYCMSNRFEYTYTYRYDGSDDYFMENNKFTLYDGWYALTNMGAWSTIENYIYSESIIYPDPSWDSEYDINYWTTNYPLNQVEWPDVYDPWGVRYEGSNFPFAWHPDGGDLTNVNTSTLTGTSRSIVQGGEWSSHYTDTNQSPSPTITNSSQSHYEYHEWVDNEFTTEELINLLNVVPSGTEWIAWGNTSDHAKSDISPTETNATVTAVTARLHINGSKGVPWNLNCYYWKSWVSNGVTNAICERTNELHGVCTGQPEYISLGDLPAPFSTYTSNGCVFYQKAESWVTVEGGGCGAGGCSSGTCGLSPGSVDAEIGSVRVTMGLGAGLYGNGSESLVLSGSEPNPTLTAPEGLQVFGAMQGSTVLRSASGAVRQVLTSLCLADVVTNSATSYSVKFYSAKGIGWSPGLDGLYNTSTATPFSICTVEQVDADTNHIRVTVDNGSTHTNDYTWSITDHAWTLDSGGGIKSQTRIWDDTALASTNIIRNAGGDIVYQEVTQNEDLPDYGQVMIKRIIGTGAAAQTNLWFYYDSTNDVNYGKLKLEIAPGGSWRRYEYDSIGRITNEVSQFLNSATNSPDSSNRVVTYSYTLLTNTAISSETRVTKLLGQEIGREYTIEYPNERLSIQCQQPGAAWTNAANLVTLTMLSTQSGFEGSPQSVLRPDGTMDIYTYETNSTEKIVTFATGQPDVSRTNIIDGTRRETRTAITGELISEKLYSISPGRADMLVSKEEYDYDNLNENYTVHHLDGTSEGRQYGCCGLELTEDRDGTVTEYHPDALKRQAGSTRLGVTTTNILDAAGNVLATIRIGTNGSAITMNQATYDTAGRMTASTNALNGVTSYSEARNGSGETVRTTTNPDAGTMVDTIFQDGSLKSTTGTAALTNYFEYGAYDGGTWTKEIKGSSNGTEWVKTYSDMLGRSWKTEYADGAFSTNGYNALGQMSLQRDPDGNGTYYFYNVKGELAATVVDVNKNGSMDTNSGPDRVVWTQTTYTNIAGAVLSGVDARRTQTWQKNGGNVLVSEQWSSVDGLCTASIASGLTNKSQIQYAGSGVRRMTNSAPDGTISYSEYSYGRLAFSTNLSTATGVAYSYDAHGRVYQATDARTGPITYGYNEADLVTTNTTPDPDGAGVGTAQTTITYYNTSLRPWRVVLPDNTAVTNLYSLTGALTNTSGSRTYPMQQTYDYAGRMQTMKTWTNYAAGTGAATTSWCYDVARGWLTNKTYADTTSVTYSNTPAGQLAQRKWARNVTTSYGYDAAGGLASVVYSDGTPAIGYGYDLLGRQTTVTNGGSLVLRRYYNDANQFLGEAYTSGPLNGLSVTNLYDSQGHRTNVALMSGSTKLYSVGYNYSGGRLASVSDGTNSAEYSYLAHSPLVEQIAFKQNGTNRMTTTKSYDLLNRLTGISSALTASPAVSFNYAYNSANQRTAVTNADNSRWAYGYDALGQVTSGKKYWSDGTAASGQQFDYIFDDIGNRRTFTQDTRSSSYTANVVNQYTSRTVPGYVNFLGEATNAATVTVNLQPSSRHSNYFRVEVAVTNTSNPLWLGLTNIAVLNQGANPDIITTNTGNLLFPQSTETFTYDYDRNLTSDSLWTNVWNGENRRTNIESRASVPTAGRVREQWTYLPDGRWVERIVSTNNGSSYVGMQTNRYVWDGNVLLAVLNGMNGLELAFMRGLDLSGSLQGAGGVGGLLAVCVGPTGPTALTNTTHFACYDGNGNVAALVNAADGQESARYEYGPFAEPLRMTGPMAKVNPIRFSTQYADDVTGDEKYLFRDYTPSTGRWLSRDPIGEEGGLNLNGFVGNDSVNGADLLGTVIICHCPEDYFSKNDIKPEMYTGDGDTYTAVKGVSGPTSGAGLILWRMLLTKHQFTAKDHSVEELKQHVQARERIVDNALKANFQFGTGNHPPARKPNESMQEYFTRVSDGITTLACESVSIIIFETGANFKYDARPYDKVWIPGDWGHIDNEAYRAGTWEVGLEGENVFHTGVSGNDEMFWGHWTHGQHSAESEKVWFGRITNYWLDLKKQEHGKPVWRKYITYPTIGLE